MFPKNLDLKISDRLQKNTLRKLSIENKGIDFLSNDYLGFSKSEDIFKKTIDLLNEKNIRQNGANGSRLLSGNNIFYQETEAYIAKLFEVDSALIFNSGYNANLGLFSSIGQRSDLFIFDELIHASIRDGIKLSNSKAFKFKHNDYENLHKLLEINQKKYENIYVVTESVFSMDGDQPDLLKIIEISNKFNAKIIIDEAHALGVYDLGLVAKLKVQNQIFATIVTFGKALGCHGAAILGNKKLKTYLINFSRPFIYTTGLPPHSIATIKTSLKHLNSKKGKKKIALLERNINFFKERIKKANLKFIESNSAIQCLIIGETKKTKKIALKLQEKGFNIKPILSPTVKENKERIRICIHSYTQEEEINSLITELKTLLPE